MSQEVMSQVEAAIKELHEVLLGEARAKADELSMPIPCREDWARRAAGVNLSAAMVLIVRRVKA
jgi:hypothetical protein